MHVKSRARALAELLQSYHPNNLDEQGYVGRMHMLLSAGEAAFARAHFVPGHFTSSSFVLNPARDAIALILHKKLGIWVQPGGHVELEDTDMPSAALREAQEELEVSGLTPLGTGLFDVDVHAIPERKDEPGHHHYDLRFLFVATSDALQASQEVQAARWVKLREIDQFPTDASVRRAAQKLAQAK